MRIAVSCVLVASLAAVAAMRAQPVDPFASQEPQIVISDTLQVAFDEYDKANNSGAETACTRVINVLQALAALDDNQQQQLVTAYELRARARFNAGNRQSARDDFRLLLAVSPGYTYGTLTAPRVGAVNQESNTLFETVKRENVGFVALTVEPEDAEVSLNGTLLPRERYSKVLPLFAGRTYRVSGRKTGYGPREIEVTVGASTSQPVSLSLDRLSSTITVITVPAGVDVILDNVSQGKTKTGLPENLARLPDVSALKGQDSVGFYEIVGVANGPHQILLRLECYRDEPIPHPISKAGDFREVRKLTGSFGQLMVNAPGGAVYVDDVRKGPVPHTQELCPRNEPYAVEVRNDRGRYIERVRPVSGQTHTINAVPKPAIAILSQVGLRDDFPSDLRRDVEAFLQPAVGMTFFAAPSAVVRSELERNRLQPSWLHYDTTGRPVSDAAIAVRPATRLDVSASLSRALDVQGVAEIVAPLGARDPNSLLLTYLASGSSVPETIPIRLDDQGSRATALAALNRKYSIKRLSSGLQLADVIGVGGALVLREVWDVTPDGELRRGDVIVSADGRKIESASELEAIVATKKDGDQMSLDVKRGAQTVRVQFGPRDFALVVSFLDETLPINKLLLDFRLAVQDERNPHWQAVARLNYAVVLIRAGNPQAALEELAKVSLPEVVANGQDIGPATVQFYMGVCLDLLGQPAEAGKAFLAASQSPNALLTADGPLVKILAEEKLKERRR